MVWLLVSREAVDSVDVMRRSILLVALSAALLQPVVAAFPRYHCLTTGHDGFACCCDPDVRSNGAPAEKACCAKKHTARPAHPATGTRVDRLPGGCDCCEIYLVEAPALERGRPTAPEAPGPAVVYAGPLHTGIATLRTASALRPHPVHDPHAPRSAPLYLLYSELRI